MKSNLITILLFTIAMNCSAQHKEIIKLWNNKVPGETEAKHPAVVSENEDNNVTRLTDVTDPCLTVFNPSKEKNNGIGIVVCPGGGYNILAIDLEGYEVAKWLSDLGYTAFVLQYRVPKKEIGALMDVQRALRMVRSDQWNFTKVGIIGFSAGGSLSARASTRSAINSYKAQDEVDKNSCRPDFTLLIYPAYLDKGGERALTSELLVNDKTPPMFIFATADDKYANSALVMSTALRDAKIPVELHLLSKGGHGYGLRTGNIAGETWPQLAEKWLTGL